MATVLRECNSDKCKGKVQGQKVDNNQDNKTQTYTCTVCGNKTTAPYNQ